MKTCIPGCHTHVDSTHSSSTTTIKPDSFGDNFYLFEINTAGQPVACQKHPLLSFAVCLRQDIYKIVIRELVLHGTRIQKSDYPVLQKLSKGFSRWPTQNKTTLRLLVKWKGVQGDNSAWVLQSIKPYIKALSQNGSSADSSFISLGVIF